MALMFVEFWRSNGVDRTPRERQLLQFARSRLGPRVNTYNVNLILRRLVSVGVLVRDCMMNKAVEYRLRRAYAFPLWPGYAREVEELLPPGHAHVNADGSYVFLVRPARGPAKEVPLHAADHFFSEFIHYRALLHGAFLGLDLRSGDHEALVREAIGEAPVAALRDVVATASLHGEDPGINALVRESRYCKALAIPEPGSDAALGTDDLSRHADSALELLHALCGHDHLVRPQFRGVKESLETRFAFLALDRVVRGRILQLIGALPPAERRSAAEKMARRFGDLPPTVDVWVRQVGPPAIPEALALSDGFTAGFARARMAPPSIAPSVANRLVGEFLTPVRNALAALA